MASPKRQKTRDNDLDYKQEKRRENTEAAEAAQQEDLNQGMQTGTHDTTRHGVNWGSSYETPQNQERKDENENTQSRPARKQDQGNKPGKV